MINNFIKYLILLLFFITPIIHSHFFDTIWIKFGFYIDWNFEFTKVIFFNIISSIIISLFIIKNFRNKYVKIPIIIIYVLFLIFLSAILSDNTSISILWNNSKWHSSLMFINIIWLLLVLMNSKKYFLRKIVKTIFYSSIIVLIIWVKEYYFPTFDYWNLSNRAISSFWHPNYLALYILLLIPFLIEKINNKYYLTIFILLSFLLILTKSAWWIIIFICFIFYKQSNIFFLKKKYFYLTLLPIIGILLFFFPEKLQSFISRFYIWETTINIIFSNIKILLIWWWLSTLENIFDIYKVKELFIFENIGFTADKPHNIFLNFFYNFWIFWLIFISYLFYILCKTYKNNPYYNSIIIFFIFCFFNFASISHYLIIILFWLIILKKQNIKNINNNYFIKILIIIFWFIAVFSIYFNINYYINEHKYYINKYHTTNNYFIKIIENNIFETNLLKNTNYNYSEFCIKLIEQRPILRNFFYCWDLFWNIDKTISLKYYNKWLEKLPDMRNKDSIYYNKYLINKLFVPERFYAEKFSNLKEVLKKVWQN